MSLRRLRTEPRELKSLEVESRKGTRHKKGKEEASEIEEIINECRVLETMKG